MLYFKWSKLCDIRFALDMIHALHLININNGKMKVRNILHKINNICKNTKPKLPFYFCGLRT